MEKSTIAEFVGDDENRAAAHPERRTRRHVPILLKLHTALTGWLSERSDWPGPNDSPAPYSPNCGLLLV